MASTYLSRTTVTPTNATKFTFSAWCKISNVSGRKCLLGYNGGNHWYIIQFDNSSSNCHFDWVEFNSGGTKVVEKTTSASLRDVNGYYHIVCKYDSTQGTVADRTKLYINGEVADLATNNNPSHMLEAPSALGGHTQLFGAYETSSNNFDGIISHAHYCDGYAYDASAFGETDATTGEWKIKADPSVTYGNNGFFILKDGNSVTDSSPNSNNFTVGGGTLTKTEDNPSNVFATLNPLDKHIAGTAPTFVNGNTRWTASGANNSNCGVRATMGASSGKYYFEAKYVIALYTNVGMSLDNGNNPWNGDGDIAGVSSFYGVQSEGKKRVAGVGTSSVFTALSNNDIGMFAYDLDNNKFWFGVNGSWVASGNPTTGDNPLGTLASGTYLPSLSNGSWGTASSTAFNFGNGYFGTTAVSSAGSNASGNGIFEYDVPTGFTALSTKGLNL